MKKYIYGAVGVAAVALALSGFYLARSYSDLEFHNRLNQDLIHAKVALEGWQSEVAQGNVSASDYRAAFSSDLTDMEHRFAADQATLASSK